ncbi:MAG: single-stranded DNA-binding protein [Thermoanaerobaculia bacterium]|nr:single-stranded DNA-binding protein [Thermoanaerobaculia bacterium]
MPSTPIRISRRLSEALTGLVFGPPVRHVYDPLVYARAPHELYLARWAGTPREVVFLGMNPGPWGMAQTGVPFGEVELVRGWVGVEAPVGRPPGEHPKRPILGFDCPRSEVSGRRLWGWARDRFGTPERFFARFFVANYCPLLFLEESGRNRTPDRLPAAERRPLLEQCDEALRELMRHLRPRLVVGVGAWAESRAREALDGSGIRVGRVLHPSPASPAANRGWRRRAETELAALGVELPA